MCVLYTIFYKNLVHLTKAELLEEGIFSSSIYLHDLVDFFSLCSFCEINLERGCAALNYAMTATEMDGTLHTDLQKSEKCREIKRKNCII